MIVNFYVDKGVIDKDNKRIKVMKIIKNLPADSMAANLYRGTAQITDGDIAIERTMYFESTTDGEDAVDVTSLAVFPKKNSAHPLHPNFKYYGNATVEPVDKNGKYWKAVLQYTTSNPNATDSSGKPITSETAPWDLRPDNISFSYPEVTLPFELAYNTKGYLKVPVVNTAGDMIPASRTVSNMQMSFTFATKSWDYSKGIDYGDTINSQSIKICGITLGAGSALMKPPDASYITVYEDGSDKIKWQYWSVNVTIVIDLHDILLKRTFLNVGNRARFSSLDISSDPMLRDAGVSGVIPATPNASQICRFRKTEKQTVGGKDFYAPIGQDIIYCSWEQYIAAREKYLNASSVLMQSGKMDSLYELQCEQEQQMPLDQGGYIDTAGIASGEYYNLTFNQYPEKSWKNLNLPSKGI